MHTARIISVGKNKEGWLEQAYQDYIMRLKSRVRVEPHWLKDSKELQDYLSKRPQTFLLDPKGEIYSSEQFHSRLLKHSLNNKGIIELAIGPDIGFSTIQKQKAKEQGLLISFSKMTFTHQMCRLILIEQLYRVTQIELKTPYHK
jgi:23S rRNA (pseudouridine1915-N3)-methyltransferase